MIAAGALGRATTVVLTPAGPPVTRLALIVTPPFGTHPAASRAAVEMERGAMRGERREQRLALDVTRSELPLAPEPPASDVAERTRDLPPLVRQRLTSAWTVLNPWTLDGASLQALVHWCARYAVSRRRGVLALRAQGYDLAACFLWRRQPADPAAFAAAGDRLVALGLWLDSEALP